MAGRAHNKIDADEAGPLNGVDPRGVAPIWDLHSVDRRDGGDDCAQGSIRNRCQNPAVEVRAQ
eukprot:6179501-Pleurochrysis_carterae.AAC.3